MLILAGWGAMLLVYFAVGAIALALFALFVIVCRQASAAIARHQARRKVIDLTPVIPIARARQLRAARSALKRSIVNRRGSAS